MRIGLFPYVDAAFLIGILPAIFWDELIPKISNRLDKIFNRNMNPVTIYYDRPCGFCRKSVLIIKNLLLLNSSKIMCSQDTEKTQEFLDLEFSWVVQDHEGNYYTKFEAGIVLLEQSPIFWWTKFMPLRAAGKFGDVFYDFVAKNRVPLSKVSASMLKENPLIPTKQGKISSVFCFGMLLYISLYVIYQLPGSQYEMVKEWKVVSKVFRTDQFWGMFAPKPSVEDGWFVIPGELIDGTKVDVFHETVGEATFEKPEVVAYEFKNARWRKYMMNIWAKKYKKHRLHYGKYLCRKWNESLPKDSNKKLSKFKIKFMREHTKPPGVEQTLKKFNLWGHDCFSGKK
jgi:predicted DCC family thiol-disulfide oxidoreductase YuxK